VCPAGGATGPGPGLCELLPGLEGRPEGGLSPVSEEGAGRPVPADGRYPGGGRAVSLPRRGRIRRKEERQVEGRILSATVNREADRWYVSLTVEVDLPDPEPVRGPVVGVDVGLHHFATVVGDDGTVAKIEAPRPLERSLRLLRRRQRQHSRKQRGSKNRRRSALRLARMHRRLRNIRRDFLHQRTTHLAKTKSGIVVEGLNVNGRLPDPYLARHIADSGWRAFRRMLADKCAWYGSRRVVADRDYPSSRTCSACGHVLETLSLDVREWACPVFGAPHDRDANAARNRLAMAG